ncbi:MAG: HAMP domain-containing sensor histidine kinase [Luteolibacter sp.]
MKHPSIRLRLVVGSGLLAALILLTASYFVYRTVRRSLHDEIEARLKQSASLLSNSAELEADGIVYEWHEAMRSGKGPPITGLFQFWDVKSGKTIRSPELGENDLPRFHGKPDQPVIRKVVLPDGTPAKVIGLLHLPFVDDPDLLEKNRIGLAAGPNDYPQILVCAVETRSLQRRLDKIRNKLAYTAGATIAGIWISILFISRWTLRPIDDLSTHLMERSGNASTEGVNLPEGLPRELTGLVTAFNAALQRVEAARNRERDFALHAAHELRTPIAGIHSVLEQAVYRPRQAEDLQQRITESLSITAGMKTTIHSLMRLARLRGGLEGIQPESFDSATMLRELAASEAIHHPGKFLAMDLTEEPLTSDPGLFRMMVANLVENAFRHSPSGSPVSIRSSKSTSGFTLDVTNDRGSLSPSEAERIFQPFQRGTDANADSPGAGLGLSLSLEISRLLGGNLSVHFENAKTVTFRVFLS